MHELAVEIGAPGQIEPDVLALAVPEGDDGPLVMGGRALDERLTEWLGRLAATGDVTGELGRSVLLHSDSDSGPRRVAAVGVGRRDRVDADALRTAASSVVKSVDGVGGTIAWALDETLPLPLDEQARAVVEGTLLGAYDQGQWRSAPTSQPQLERLVLLTDAGGDLAAAGARAATVARWVNAARDLANSPPNELTPAALAERAGAIDVDHLTVEALDVARIDELGMGALAAVGRASANEPRLVVLRYDPPSPARADVTLGLVGKAITFDAGGISLKPALKMYDMKGDMAGGAGVIGGIAAVAELGLPVRIVAVVAAAENLVSGDAFRPGDILRAANGKTIEITNTDAEGRLVLADGLWYARREGATHLLDLATLTGAMELALGDLYAGMFANDDTWAGTILAAAERSGDHTWQFPLHPRYRRYVDSAFADMKNSSELRQAAPALAAAFLEEFAGDGPWAHIDMAGPGFLERSRGDYLHQPGGTGYGVRLIVELAQSLTA